MSLFPFKNFFKLLDRRKLYLIYFHVLCKTLLLLRYNYIKIWVCHSFIYLPLRAHEATFCDTSNWNAAPKSIVLQRMSDVAKMTCWFWRKVSLLGIPAPLCALELSHGRRTQLFLCALSCVGGARHLPPPPRSRKDWCLSPDSQGG